MVHSSYSSTPEAGRDPSRVHESGAVADASLPFTLELSPACGLKGEAQF